MYMYMYVYMCICVYMCIYTYVLYVYIICIYIYIFSFNVLNGSFSTLGQFPHTYFFYQYSAEYFKSILCTFLHYFYVYTFLCSRTLAALAPPGSQLHYLNSGRPLTFAHLPPWTTVYNFFQVVSGINRVKLIYFPLLRFYCHFFTCFLQF